MYKYKVNGKELYASGLSEVIDLFHSVFGSEEIRSVIRYGGNLVK